MPYRSRRRTSGYARGRYGRPVRSARRGRGYSVRGRGRYRARGRSAGQTVRLVIQTPSDMLPVRPTVSGFARIPRRARF